MNYELVLKCARVRRRKRNGTVPLIEAGDLTIDPARRSVTRAGVHIGVCPGKEFDILEYLVLNKGRVLSRDMIINHAWHINVWRYRFG